MTTRPAARNVAVWAARALLGPGGMAAVCVVLALTAAAAQTTGPETGLPLPRFVSLRATEAHVRTGPGVRYPVDWVYTRRSMPLEITAEYEYWRKIRDWEGTEGWMHKSMLSGRRMLLVTGEVRTLREKPSEETAAVARAEPGVIGKLLECTITWCRLEVEGHKGWLRRDEVWGVRDGEIIE